MKKALELYKKEGETPLETIEGFKAENPEYKDEKMTYAGRLDPMAEGVLLVLVDDECRNKEKYLGLDKEYEFEILWGFKTDTYDILGIPQPKSKQPFLDSAESQNRFVEKLETLLEKNKGKFIQKYPPYSSMTVRGKQLHQWAKEGKLDEIKIPEREIEVYNIEFLENKEIKIQNLLKNIIERIEKVKGDFRQDQIIKEWKKIFHELSDGQQKFVISKARIKCSSGTYVRGIVNELGEKLDVGAIAFSIKRTKIFQK